MNIPQNRYLVSQSFNFDFNLIEFVWHFPIDEKNKNKIVYTVYKNGKTLLSEETIQLCGDFIDFMGDEYTTSDVISTKNISKNELLALKQLTVKFLNNEN